MHLVISPYLYTHIDASLSIRMQRSSLQQRSKLVSPRPRLFKDGRWWGWPKHVASAEVVQNLNVQVCELLLSLTRLGAHACFQPEKPGRNPWAQNPNTTLLGPARPLPSRSRLSAPSPNAWHQAGLHQGSAAASAYSKNGIQQEHSFGLKRPDTA